MKPAPFEYYAPTSVEEALALLAEHGYDAKVLAGGQSLIPTSGSAFGSNRSEQRLGLVFYPLGREWRCASGSDDAPRSSGI